MADVIAFVSWFVLAVCPVSMAICWISFNAVVLIIAVPFCKKSLLIL